MINLLGKAPKILVIGDLMVDYYLWGSSDRISPEAPVPVVSINNESRVLGGAGNVINNLKALNAKVDVMSVLGECGVSSELKLLLNEIEIDTQYLITEANRIGSKKTRIIAAQQQVVRYDQENSTEITETSQKTLLSNFRKRITDYDCVLLSDYGKGALQDIIDLIDLGRSRNIPIIVDPKGSEFTKYRGATLITPNLSEFEAVVGGSDNEDELVNKGLRLVRELNLEAILITRGEHGMTLIRPDSPELHLPARAQEVFDVTGAGDTVISVLAASMAAGDGLADATALANLAAGLVVGKLGTAAISGPELRRAMLSDQNSGRGVMTAEQLQIVVQDAKAHGEKIIFTNGCFDIIHAGHVGYLAEAKRLGDRLVVAINDDDSAHRLKGPGRPINPVERRMAVLAGLEAVDWVVSFSEDTPEPLLESLQPEVLVKGGDYSMDQVVGGSYVKSYGGMVRVLEFLDNCSTSAIMEKMKEVGE